ncbi:MAG: GDP-mannose 4,6-dehydratase [bacterium]|nr:GDP-mannose 4,6-dehydratase [bacterium]
MKKKKALITGITGQDGSYLSELLLSKGYEVFGMIPRRSTPETQTLRVEHISHKLVLEYGDVLDLASIYRIMNVVKPDEVYHLAAQSHVQVSFYEPIHTTTVDALGTLNMLEATTEFVPKAKFYNAASSEMFGNTPDYPITEDSKMIPCSPYGAAKLYAYHITQVYRVSKKLFAVNGILFNHESPRRGLNFVTAKVVKGALDIKYGNKKELQLGDLDSSRDWGHAKDYVYAMWLMLQNNTPKDYIVATGIETTVRRLCEYTFSKLKLGDYKKYVKVVDKYCRPYELNHLKGNPAKIKKELGWKPQYSFEDLIDEMISEIKKRFYPDK